MFYLNRTGLAFTFSFLCIATQWCFGQIDLNEKLTLDPKVKTGKLENGLTYYIRENNKPEQKVELRLVVNTGSVLEAEDQQGFAHLAEHMAFNGTTHFKKNDIVSFLQSIGVSFGNDLNAYTGFNETVYILPIPTDKPGNIDKGFQILEDWAHNVSYTSDDIEGERPVVLEESRLGKGAGDRMYRKIYPKLYAGSLYSNRLPIGIDSIIKSGKADQLRQFYKEWYRPDLMAVIVVGDIDASKAAEKVKKYFSRLTNPPSPRQRTTPEVRPYGSNEALVVTDKEATDYGLLINYSFQKNHLPATVSDFKQEIVKRVFTTILNQRLRELTQKENPPFIYAATGFSDETRGYEAFVGDIGIGTGDAIKALEAFTEEVGRVQKYGFTQSELDRVKKNLLSGIERAFNEKGKTESSNYANEYIHNFLVQEPSPGIEKENEYYQALVPAITLNEVNGVAKYLNNNNKFIALTGPEPVAGKNLPTSDQLLAASVATEKMNIIPYEEKVLATALLKDVPKGGKITGAKKNLYLGTTELTLNNGVTVTLKVTSFKNDQVLMGAVRPGGKNNYLLRDKFSAEYATEVVSSMGAGDFSPTDLRKILAGKIASVSPVFTATTDGFAGSSSVKDVETMLQLMYLYFTSPRKDTSLFKSFIQKNKSQMALLAANPQVAFVDTIFSIAYNNNPLAGGAYPKPGDFDKINLDRALEIYKERFGNVNGMHFTFVGNFKEDELNPLIEKYIGALPSSSQVFYYADNKVRSVKGKIDIPFKKGQEQKSLIVAIYTGEVPFSEDLELKAGAISEILNIRIIQELREKIQGIYGGGISARFDRVPYPHYSFVLQLPCGPEKVDTLLYAANKEIANLKQYGPSRENLDKVKQQWRETYKVSMKENSTWLGELQSLTFPGGDPKRFIEYEKYVNGLTPKGIQEAAKLLLSGANVITGILRPEK